MKKEILLVMLLCLKFQLKPQVEEHCLVKEFMVVAENLNFRSEPNMESKILSKLDHSERLRVIEVHNEYAEKRNPCYLSVEWLNVRRIKTGEVGYVSSRYVKPVNIAYLNGQSADRLQNAYWYGIYNENGRAKIKKVMPKLTRETDGEIFLESDKYKLIIGSQEELKEGNVEGELFQYPNEYIKIGTNRKLLSMGEKEFRLVCTGEVELANAYELSRFKERLLFLSIKSYKDYEVQDLSTCLLGFGNIGYQIHFIGDLNRDGFPELILSETGDTEGGVLYYFMSNEEGKLELKSLTDGGNGC